MKTRAPGPIFQSRNFMIFAIVMAMLSALGGYQLSQLVSQVNDSSARRSVQLLEIEEDLDDAAIGLGRQVQEWKDMLLRSSDRGVYDKHQQGFKEASIAVQYALLKAKTAMQNIGMDTAAIDHLIGEHKSLLSKYLNAHSKLQTMDGDFPGAVDKQVLGVDRRLQNEITSVKDGISNFAKQQMFRAPETQGNRYLMMGLLGAFALFFMALLGYSFGCLLQGRGDRAGH